VLFLQQGISQLSGYEAMIDTLLLKDPISGFLWWKQPNTFIPGQCLQQYKVISGDTLNDAILEKYWIDNELEMKHYRFNQTYKGVPLESAVIIEHFTKEGKLIFTNGKLAIDLNLSVIPQLSENSAKQALLNYFPNNYEMAWEDSVWENDLKTESGNPLATFEPHGELILALNNNEHLDFYISGSRYRLAYKFKVLCISPYINSFFFVDAQTGEIFKEQTNIHNDHFATVLNSGGSEERIIDTRWRGFPHYDFVLQTNDNDIEIHTKRYSTHGFNIRPEIDKEEEPWVGFEGNATTTHWYTEQA
jgi:Zn-dependent metalloprotease